MHHEDKHIKRIVGLDPLINQLFNEFIAKAAPWLKKVRYNRRGIWSANPVIEAKIDELLREFAKKYQDLLQKYMEAAWERSDRKNDELFLKFFKGLGVVLGAHFLLKTFNRQTPQKGQSVTLDKIVKLSRNTAARDTFIKNRLSEVISPRIWDLSGQNKKLILNLVKSGILEGKSAQAISQDLRKYLRDPNQLFRRVKNPETGEYKPSKAMKAYHPGQGVYRSSYKNALRLARNEVNMAYRKADMTRWQQTDFVLGYDVKLSGSHPCYDLCDEMAGRYPKDFTFLSWHIQCYCYAVPVLPAKGIFIDHIKNDTQIRGYVKGIPARAERYIKSKAEKIMAMPSRKRPYWIMDNYKIDGKELKPNIHKSKKHGYAK